MTSLEEMSGEKGSNPKLILNEVVINGAEGKFKFRKVVAGLIEVDGKKKYEEVEIGDSIKVVFLKIRRKLQQHRKGRKPLVTNEHTHKDNFVSLFGGDKIIRGVASEIREANEGLRTVQVVYALYEGELIRLIVRGSSLGSQNKAKDVKGFYEYIGSFKEGGREAHFYESYTELIAIEEKGDLGAYFCMSYKEGEKLDETEMKLVTEKMQVAFDYSEQVDSFYGAGSQPVTKKATVDEEIPIIEEGDGMDGEGEIDTKDIPF